MRLQAMSTASRRAEEAKMLNFWDRVGSGVTTGRWPTQKNLEFFTPKIEEMLQFDEHIFQRGWNHQLGEELKNTCTSTHSTQWSHHSWWTRSHHPLEIQIEEWKHALWLDFFTQSVFAVSRFKVVFWNIRRWTRNGFKLYQFWVN